MTHIRLYLAEVVLGMRPSSAGMGAPSSGASNGCRMVGMLGLYANL